MRVTCIPTVRELPEGWRIRLCFGDHEAPVILDAKAARRLARKFDAEGEHGWARVLRKLADTLDRRNRGDA